MSGRYLKDKRKLIIFLCICSIIFALVFYVANQDVVTVLYAGLLCLVFGLIVAVLDYLMLKKKHRMLDDMKTSIYIEAGKFPEAVSLLEEDYQNLLHSLLAQKNTLERESYHRYQEMNDYYTMWVHQIKTPIAAMRLLLQREESEKNEELTEQLFKIEQYVEMVLQYLRSESMSSDFDFREYDLDNMIKSALRKYAKSFIRKKLSLQYEAVQCKVLTDKKWLQFVIEQMLSNALKYTSQGTISIYLARGQGKTLVIEDTGIGIQAEDLPRVFERGFTGYNGRTDKKSTGIGLYLSSRIITKLSHEIQLESEVGKGTKVYIDMNTVDRLGD